MAAMELMKALIRGCLPDDLSILQWVHLIHQDPDNQPDYDDAIKKRTLKLKRDREIEKLIAACKDGLPHYGNMEGSSWLWSGGAKNPYPRIDNGIFIKGERKLISTEELEELVHYGDFNEEIEYLPSDCLINKKYMNGYLFNKGKLPIKGLSDDWWPKNELETGTMGDAGAGSQGKTKPANVNGNSNYFDKRLVVLKAWLNKQDFYLPDGITTLPKEFTHKKVQIELNNESSDKSLFDLTLDSFKRHFWQKQKIAKLKSGR